MVLRTKIFEDKAGNKLFREAGQLAVRNAQGQIVDPTDTRKFLRQQKVQVAIKRSFGREVGLKILKPREKGVTKVGGFKIGAKGERI